MTASILPPLPEAGPTTEVELQEEPKLPASELPSAHTSPVGNIEEEKGEEVEQVLKAATPAADAEPSARHAKHRHLFPPQTSSTESREDELRDSSNSGTSPPAKSSPLVVSPQASRPPPTLSRIPRFGVLTLGNEPDSHEDE